MGRDRHPAKALGSLHARIKESRVLMVGAGGIGCELLKNLVMTGYGEIHIVDLDTIDLSNLNRQFLFGMQHIKKSKAFVAKETAGKFNPNVKLEAHHANIKDPQFNVKWFKGFTLVFNALDNLDARKHVNRMCLTADVPLIESGTMGYTGQVQVIKGGKTECYECMEKPVEKGFPVCTIRSTPSQPVHCVVWAKSYLFTEIFGMSEESSPELDATEDAENAQEISNLKREAEELKNMRDKMGSPDFAETVSQKVFKADIERLLSMEDMWKSRTSPKPLDYAVVAELAKDIPGSIAKTDQRSWTLAENYAVFADSLRRLAVRMQDLKAAVKEGDAPPILSFDKDDEDTLDFVAASANLRSIIFNIEPKSKFDIKKIAGNIIPAIATTNAIIAGLCVLQSFKVFRNDFDSQRNVYTSRDGEKALAPEKLCPPRPGCEVCGVARMAIEADIEKATLGDIVNMLRKTLAYGEEISVLTNQLLYDADFDDNGDTPLKELGFGEETFVTVKDEDEDSDEGRRVNLVMAVTHAERSQEDPLEIPTPIEIRRVPKKEPTPVPADDMEFEVSVTPVINGIKAVNGTNGTGTKRHIEDLEEVSLEDAAPTSKKRKISNDFALVEDREIKKRARVPENGGKSKEDGIVLEDDGVITID